MKIKNVKIRMRNGLMSVADKVYEAGNLLEVTLGLSSEMAINAYMVQLC